MWTKKEQTQKHRSKSETFPSYHFILHGNNLMSSYRLTQFSSKLTAIASDHRVIYSMLLHFFSFSNLFDVIPFLQFHTWTRILFRFNPCVTVGMGEWHRNWYRKPSSHISEQLWPFTAFAFFYVTMSFMGSSITYARESFVTIEWMHYASAFAFAHNSQRPHRYVHHSDAIDEFLGTKPDFSEQHK